MKGKNSVKVYRQSTVNAIIIILILALFIYFTAQITSGFSDTVSTQRTQIVTDEKYSYFTGFIFKDETVIDMGQAYVADYLVSNGEKVGMDKEYALLYPAENLSIDKRLDVQASLNDINSRIARLEGGKDVGGVVADLAHINETLSDSYYSYVDSILKGELEAAEPYGEELLSAMVDYSVITGREGVTESALFSLTKQKSDLLTSLGGSPISHAATESCYFYYETDGFEYIFNTDQLDALSPAQMLELTERKAEKYGEGVIGKTIYNPKWYLSVPLDADVCGDFKEGRIYSVAFSDNGSVTIKMALERIVCDGADAYLLFSSYDLSAIQDFSRAQSIKVLMTSTTGFRIPSESLTKLYGEDGVFILIGTEVAFRRITKLSEGNGYYIVKTYQADAEEQKKIEEEGGVISDIPYLNANDLIITSGNDLYDGKFID